MPKCLLGSIRRYRTSPGVCYEDSPPTSVGGTVDGSDNSDCSTGPIRSARSSQRKPAKRKRSLNQLSVVTRFYMHTERTEGGEGGPCPQKEEGAEHGAGCAGFVTDDGASRQVLQSLITDPLSHTAPHSVPAPGWGKPRQLKAKLTLAQEKLTLAQDTAGEDNVTRGEVQGSKDGSRVLHSAEGGCLDTVQPVLHAACLGLVDANRQQLETALASSALQHPPMASLRYISPSEPRQGDTAFPARPTLLSFAPQPAADDLRCPSGPGTSGVLGSASYLPLALPSALNTVQQTEKNSEHMQPIESTVPCVFTTGLLVGDQLTPVAVMQSMWLQPHPLLIPAHQPVPPTSLPENHEPAPQLGTPAMAGQQQVSGMKECAERHPVTLRDQLCRSDFTTGSPPLKVTDFDVSSVDPKGSVCLLPAKRAPADCGASDIRPVEVASSRPLVHDQLIPTTSEPPHDTTPQSSLAASSHGFCAEMATQKASSQVTTHDITRQTNFTICTKEEDGISYVKDLDSSCGQRDNSIFRRTETVSKKNTPRHSGEGWNDSCSHQSKLYQCLKGTMERELSKAESHVGSNALTVCPQSSFSDLLTHKDQSIFASESHQSNLLTHTDQSASSSESHRTNLLTPSDQSSSGEHHRSNLSTVSETKMPNTADSCPAAEPSAFYSALLQSCIPLLRSDTPNPVTAAPCAQQAISSVPVGEGMPPLNPTHASPEDVCMEDGNTSNPETAGNENKKTADGSKRNTVCSTPSASGQGSEQRGQAMTCRDTAGTGSWKGTVSTPDLNRHTESNNTWYPDSGYIRHSDHNAVQNSVRLSNGITGQVNTSVADHVASSVTEHCENSTTQQKGSVMDASTVKTRDQSVTGHSQDKSEGRRKPRADVSEHKSGSQQHDQQNTDTDSAQCHTSFTKLQSSRASADKGSSSCGQQDENRTDSRVSHGQTRGSSYSSQWISAVAACIAAQPSPFPVLPLPVPTLLASVNHLQPSMPTSYLFAANPCANLIRTPFNNVTGQCANGSVPNLGDSAVMRGRGSDSRVEKGLSVNPTASTVNNALTLLADSRHTDTQLSYCRDARHNTLLLYSSATKGSAEGPVKNSLDGTGQGDSAASSPQCSECCQQFLSLRDLHYHMSAHERDRRGGESGGVERGNQAVTEAGDARNKCGVCSRVFTRSWLLKGHMRTHTGERPFRCTWPQCQRAFADKSNLRSHTLIHTTTAKSFTCPKCSRAFSQKRYLHKHMLEVCRII